MQKISKELKKGNFIIVYDGDKREGEADLIFHAKFATPEKIEQIRKDASGLICVALGRKIAEKIGIIFATDILKKAGFGDIACQKTAYGDVPAFSISINHKKVYTGITDNDRALTIREIAKIPDSKNATKQFKTNFYSPGHIFLLIGRGIKKRKGHTELCLELAKKAGLNETMVMCEMLGKGKALSKEQAKKYAEKNGIVFIEGEKIWKK